MILPLLALFVFAACGNKSRQEEARPLLQLDAKYPSRVGEVTPSGLTLGGIFRINETADPRSLDPIRTGETSAHHVTTHIYDALFDFDNDLNLQPCLAKSYEISADGLVYTFHLQPDVRFHDDPCFPGGQGRVLTARDLEYSFTRVVDPKLPSTGAWLFNLVVVGVEEYRQGKSDHVSGFQVVNDSTLVIHLIQPFAPFLYRLAMSYCFVIPHEAVEHYGEDFFQHPVGTGPFQFVYWKPDQEILLIRNPHYWQKDDEGTQLPYLDGVQFQLIKDFKTEFLKFDLGGLDHVQRIHEDVWPKIFDEQGMVQPEYKKYLLQTKSMLITQFYGFNLTLLPYKDNQALRQAFNYAIDRENICRFVMKGRGIPAIGIVPYGMPGYFTEKPQADESSLTSPLFNPTEMLAPESIAMPYTYDPEKAKALLAEAGYPGGKGLDDVVLQINSGGTLNESVAEAIQGQLLAVGIPLRIQVIEWSQHLENIDQNLSPFFRLGWNADYPSPENFLALFWSKNFAPVGPNYSRFASAEFDRLFEAAIHATDISQQNALFRQAEKIVLDEAPILLITNDRLSKLTQPYVINMGINAMDIPLLKRVWLELKG